MTSNAPANANPPLDAAALSRDLAGSGGFWREVVVVPATGSTNTELLQRARDGAAEGAVLVTEHQTAGRGRLDRSFDTPPRAAVTFSVLLRPQVPPARYGWLPLLMGVATVHAVEGVAGLPAARRAGLKWPNDVLVRGGGQERKLAGILSEAATDPDTGTAIVIGTGLNVRQQDAGLPTDTATSLLAEGAANADRDAVLRAILRGFADRYQTWQAHGGDAEVCGLAKEYRASCATLGRQVRVMLPGGQRVEGTASDVDDSGRLLVRTGDGAEQAFSAGDVVHVRRTPSP